MKEKENNTTTRGRLVAIITICALISIISGVFALATGRGVSFSMPVTLDPNTFLKIEMQFDYEGDGVFEEDKYTIFDNTASGSVSWAYVSEGAISFAKNSPIKNVSNDTVYKLFFTNLSGDNTYLTITENYDESFYNKPFTSHPQCGILGLANNDTAELIVYSNPVLTTGLYPFPLKVEKSTEQTNVATVSLNVKNAETSLPTSFNIPASQTFKTTFTANSGYVLPSQVEITQNSTALEKDVDYRWNQETGELTIYSTKTTGALSIKLTAAVAEWTGEVATSFASGGTGSADDPIKISTPEEFKYMANLVNNAEDTSYQTKSYKLETDIIMNTGKFSLDANNEILYNGQPITEETNLQKWTPIGDYNTNPSYIFNGVLDGNGYIFSGLYIGDPSLDYQGLTGYTQSEAELINITLENSVVVGNDNVGGICGHNYLGLVLSNCKNLNGVVKGHSFVGGILSWSEGGAIEIIENCINSSTILATGGYVAGIVARPNTGAGSSTRVTTIISCINYGDVTATSNHVAGICGHGHSGSDIYECINYGNIKGNVYVSGVLGSKTHNSTTDISFITNCANYGNITGNRYIAAIIGMRETPKQEGVSTINIEHCYNLGQIRGSCNVGTISGIDGENILYTNNYYLANSAVDGAGVIQNGVGNATTGQTTADIAGENKAMNLADFKNSDNFSGWDFENVWQISPFLNNGLPFLRGLIEFIK